MMTSLDGIATITTLCDHILVKSPIFPGHWHLKYGSLPGNTGDSRILGARI